MENKPAVVFRRINGRVIPIRAKNGVAQQKNDRSVAGMIRGSAASGAAAGGAAFGATKGGQKWLDMRIKDLGNEIKAKKMKEPKKPKPFAAWKNAAPNLDPQLRGTGLGNTEQARNARGPYEKAVGQYKRQFTKYTKTKKAVELLRGQEIQYIRFRKILSFHTPKAVIGAALLGAGAYAASSIFGGKNGK